MLYRKGRKCKCLRTRIPIIKIGRYLILLVKIWRYMLFKDEFLIDE